jgi:hypothetical protein
MIGSIKYPHYSSLLLFIFSACSGYLSIYFLPQSKIENELIYSFTITEIEHIMSIKFCCANELLSYICVSQLT